MCPPIVLAVASAGISAMGAIQQANAQAAAAERQAAQYRAQQELQNRQATIEARAGQYQEQQRRVQLDALSGKQRNMVAGSGFSLSGSPTDVIIDSRREGELDVAAVRFGTNVKTDNLRYSAAVSGMNAAGADQAAETARSSGILGAISPFIGLGSKFTSLGGGFGGGTAGTGGLW